MVIDFRTVCIAMAAITSLQHELLAQRTGLKQRRRNSMLSSCSGLLNHKKVARDDASLMVQTRVGSRDGG